MYNHAMKINPVITLTIVGALLALTTTAQEGPIRIFPSPQPGIAVDPAFPHDEEFPEPGEVMVEPGFPGDMMMMPPMPGRYKIITVQMPQAGKLAPVVLKLDTQTGEVWQLKLTETKFFHNGKPQVHTNLDFIRVGETPGHGHELRHDGHGREDVAPGRPQIGRTEPGEDPKAATIDAVPVRPRPRVIREPRRAPERRDTPQTSPAPRPRR
jgi:hypothetical protein